MKVYAENGVLDRCRRLLLVSRWSLYWSFCASKNENRWTLWLVDGQSLTPVLLLELHELFLPIQDLKAWSESFADLDSVTVFENHNKSRIQHCERSELRLHFKWQKFIKNAKNSQFGMFLKMRHFEGFPNTVHRLRKKIGVKFIQTVKKVGLHSIMKIFLKTNEKKILNFVKMITFSTKPHTHLTHCYKSLILTQKVNFEIPWILKKIWILTPKLLYLPLKKYKKFEFSRQKSRFCPKTEFWKNFEEINFENFNQF